MSPDKGLRYVDFGFESAKEFWFDVVLPAHERFRSVPSRANAMDAATHLWHFHEWLWHDNLHGRDKRRDDDYKAFCSKLEEECPQIFWVRDIADASKHRGLSSRKDRPWSEVVRVSPEIIRLVDDFGYGLVDDFGFRLGNGARDRGGRQSNPVKGCL